MDIKHLQKRIGEANKAFTPYKPVSEESLFCGRESELLQIIKALSAGGRHVLLYGDRGVGKTSLARQSCRLNETEFKIHQCSSSDTFLSIMEGFFVDLGLEHSIAKETTLSGGVKLAIANGGADTATQKKVIYEPSNPSWVGTQLRNIKCVLIIDEFDVIASREEKTKVSELIKFLSDMDADTKILIVGIATSAHDLISGHESIARCLEEVHLGRMTDDELSRILKNGAERLSMTFDNSVIKRIVEVSNGFPYFTQSLGLESVLVAIRNDCSFVSMDYYEQGVVNAMKSMDQSLQDSYKEAVGNRNNLNKRQLLYSVATSTNTQITTQEIKKLHQKEYDIDLADVNINMFLSKAMGRDRSSLLQRIRQGVYVFSNPLMPVYIRLLGKPPVAE